MSNDPLIDALTNIDQTNPDGAKTRREISLELGLCADTVSTRLRELYDAGRLECIMVKRPTMSGGMATVPAYRIKSEAAE